MTLEELRIEAEKLGVSLVEKPKNQLHEYTVIVRYDRGLGPEYINLKSVFAKTPNDAQLLAEQQAFCLFATEDDFKKAVINEVKIKDWSNRE